ncbi:hypothetical protein L9F63_020713, partial [Diploptera punctata]
KIFVVYKNMTMAVILKKKGPVTNSNRSTVTGKLVPTVHHPNRLFRTSRSLQWQNMADNRHFLLSRRVRMFEYWNLTSPQYALL